MNEAYAGDIVVVSGFEGIEIGKTLTDPAHPDRLLGIAVEEPTISVDFMVNNSPFAGREGKFVTSRQVRDRLFKELEKNVALNVEETEAPDTLQVSGRGELHLAILMETMRREGFEFQVSRPRVITKDGPKGERLEPYEELMIDVPEEYMGVIMEKAGSPAGRAHRNAKPGAGVGPSDVQDPGPGPLRVPLRVPDRHPGHGADPPPVPGVRALGRAAGRAGSAGSWWPTVRAPSWPSPWATSRSGARCSCPPGDLVYEGMVVGESARPGDMDVNVTKEKKLTNMRTTASDDHIVLEPPREITLEYGLEYIEEDELIEVTPRSVRLRKRMLQAVDRRRAARAAARMADAS